MSLRQPYHVSLLHWTPCMCHTPVALLLCRPFLPTPTFYAPPSATTDPALLKSRGAQQMEQRHATGWAATLRQTVGLASHMTQPGRAGSWGLPRDS